MQNVATAMGLPPELRRKFDGTQGHTLRAVTGTVVFGDDGTAVELGQIREGDIPIGVVVNVTTAFDGTGTDLLDVGTGTDADGYVNDHDLSSTGNSGVIGAGALAGIAATATDTIEALYTDANSDAAAGSAQVTVFYLEGPGVSQ